MEDVKESEKTADKDGWIKNILKHVISDVFHGIHGIVPPKGLHTFRSGVHEFFLSTLVDLIDTASREK